MKSTAFSGNAMNAWDFHQRIRAQRSRAMYASAVKLATRLMQRVSRSRFVIQLKEVA